MAKKLDAKKLDAALVLSRLAEIRKAIPFLGESTPRRSREGRLDCRTAEEFEYAAVAEGLENFADDLSAAIDKAQAEATAAALRIYYAAEELARDPENAHIVPYVERMREAYRSSYGRPIPPKPEG
jgi:hypothetical protein